MTEKWREYPLAWDMLPDSEIEDMARASMEIIDAHQTRLEAIASWVAAGRPRTKKENEANGD